MSVNKLLFAVTRGQWFLDVNNIHAYLPLLQNYFAGKAVYTKEPIEAVNKIMQADGKSENKDTSEAYAYLSMQGVMTRYGGDCAYGAEDYMAMLDEIDANPKIKGTVLYINGPGGAADALIPILEYGKRKQKKIVGLIGTAASAHYWAGVSLCDYLIAEHPTLSLVGSVGAMITLADLKEKYEKDGIKIHEIYAPESEHKNEVYRLAFEGKYDQIKDEMLSPMAKEFQNAVRANRPNLKEDTGVLTGKMFTASRAKELGMIDQIGNINDAINMIDILTEINS